MKKLLLTLLGFALFQSIQAQTTCMPDETVPDTAIVSPLPFSDARPDGGIQDTACVGSPYEYVFTFNIPEVYTTDFGDIPLLSVDVAPEAGISNLPASFDYVCNPPNCVFPKETKGCIVVYGTAAAGQEGTYDLTLFATVRTGIIDPVLSVPADLEPGSHYYLIVKPEGFENCQMSSTQETSASNFSIRNHPNPFRDFTTIVVNSKVSGDFNFAVTDLFGKVVQQSQYQVLPGEQSIEFDGSQLPDGFYLYTFSNGREAVTRKMVISKR